MYYTCNKVQITAIVFDLTFIFPWKANKYDYNIFLSKNVKYMSFIWNRGTEVISGKTGNDSQLFYLKCFPYSNLLTHQVPFFISIHSEQLRVRIILMKLNCGYSLNFVWYLHGKKHIFLKWFGTHFLFIRSYILIAIQIFVEKTYITYHRYNLYTFTLLVYNKHFTNNEIFGKTSNI